MGTATWGSAIRDDSLDALYTAFRSAGGNFFDSAHCYAFWLDRLGASETSLGELVRKHGDRESVVIATKGGHPAGGDRYPRSDFYLAPEVIASDMNESLARLRMDTIDLYFLHRDDTRMPVGEIICAMNEHITAGRIRYLGASNWSTARIEGANTYARSHNLEGFVVSQPQWSLASPNAPVPTTDPSNRFVTPEMRAWHAQHDFPLVAYSATASGYMANPDRRSASSFDNPLSRRRHQRAVDLAAKLGQTPNAIALAYLLNQPFPVFPVLGTTQLPHLAESLRAADVVLTPAQLTWLEAAETV
jgi:aryl-alcohol dehydrogenase-like predicted oxidoreductase